MVAHHSSGGVGLDPPTVGGDPYKGFLYQAASWKTARRVLAKVEYRAGEWFPRVGFIVTNLETPSRAVMRFYMRIVSQCRRKAGWVYDQCRF